MSGEFEAFWEAVPKEHRALVAGLHERLTRQGCTIQIKQAKSGPAVSYQWEKRAVMNWVFRKSGVWARIYGDHVRQYQDLIAALPTGMQEKMTGARDCKRLLDPSACSPTCVKGFVYALNGTTHQKCRNDGMLFPLSAETGPHIQALAAAEVSARQSALH